MNESWRKLIKNLVKKDILKSPKIIRAMEMVPRHFFISEKNKPHAALDTPLPTIDGQTISAPQI
ncbi:MAG: hypothetical protein ACXAAI_10135 [Promethearchaeota archaeon]